MSYAVTTPPASEPLTRDEAKNHLKVDYDADNNLIDLLISAARQKAEAYTNLGLLPQTVTEKIDGFGINDISLSASPLRSITSISYLDEAGQPQALALTDLVIDDLSKPATFSLANAKSWPTVLLQKNAVSITYIIGYADAEAVPAAIKNAMLLMIAHWYENRQDTVRRMPTASENLLWHYRVIQG